MSHTDDIIFPIEGTANGQKISTSIKESKEEVNKLRSFQSLMHMLI